MEMIKKYIDQQGNEVGYAELLDNSEYFYCKYIEIYPQYRKCNYATMFVDSILNEINKPLRYSITGAESSGGKFWAKYTKNKKVKQIKKNTFEIA